MSNLKDGKPDRRLPGRPTPGSGPPSPPRFRLSWGTLAIIMGVVILFDAYFYRGMVQGTGPEIGLVYSSSGPLSFLSQVDDGHIKTALLSSSNVSGDFRVPLRYKGKTYVRYSVTILPQQVNQVTKHLQAHRVRLSNQSSSVPAWLSILGLFSYALPFLILIGLFYFGTRMARQQTQGVFGFGQGRGKLYTEERPQTTFADVAGVDTAKAELTEIVDFLREPAKYHRLGARIPKGALLVGPPGTGKTLLARAIAGEANVPFLAISATEFVELFVGVGASRVRDLFTRAKAVAPSIIFVDEIDAIGGARGGRNPISGGGNDEREQTLNQMLVSMDGFEPNEAVIVLAATNRPDVLDPALLRPGRFDREVVVDPPDRRGREAILKIHTRNMPLASDVDLTNMARATPGMSGADLANLANEAALTAARRNRSQVTEADFLYALDRVTLGLEGSPLMNEEERRTVAYHESGHALVAFMLPNVDPVNRITITPRGRSLGVTQFLPVDDRRNYRRDYLLNRMAVGMGGRAAEEIVFEDITSGAQNDLQMVTSVARTMVTQLGMADELGPTYLGGAGDDALSGRRYNPFEPKEYSDETATRIDEAVSRLVNEAHDRAVQVLRGHGEALEAVADALLHEESLDRQEFAAIVNAHLPAGEKPLPVPTGDPTPIGEEPQAVKAPG